MSSSAMQMAKEPEDQAKTQMLEAAKISQAFNEFLHNPFPTWNECIEVIKNIWVDDGRSKIWLLDIIPEQRKQKLHPWHDEVQLDYFKAVSVMDYRKLAREGGNLSTIGFRYFGSQATRYPRSLADDELFAIGMLPGAAGIITGVPGSGKSDFAVSEIYRVAVRNPKNQVIHNMSIEKQPKNSHYSARLSETLEMMIRHSLAGVRSKKKEPYLTVWIFDEAQKDRSRTKATRNEVMAQTQITLLMRKIGGFQWLIYQQDNPPREVREFATHRVYKISRTHQDWVDFKLTSPKVKTGLLKIEGVRGMKQRMEDYEKNPCDKNMYYVFDTFAVSGMMVDLHPILMFNYATSKGEQKSEGYYESLLEYLRMLKSPNEMPVVTKEQEIEMAAHIRLRFEGDKDPNWKRIASYSNLAHLFGWDLDKKPETATQEMRRSVQDWLKSKEWQHLDGMETELGTTDADEDVED